MSFTWINKGSRTPIMFGFERLVGSKGMGPSCPGGVAGLSAIMKFLESLELEVPN